MALLRASALIVILLVAAVPPAPAAEPWQGCQAGACSIATFYVHDDGRARLEDPARPSAAMFVLTEGPGNAFVFRSVVPEGGLRVPEHAALRLVLVDRASLVSGIHETTVVATLDSSTTPWASAQLGRATFTAEHGKPIPDESRPFADLARDASQALDDDDGAADAANAGIDTFCSRHVLRNIAPGPFEEACRDIHGDPGLASTRPCRGSPNQPPGSTAYLVLSLVYREAQKTRPCTVSIRDDANETLEAAGPGPVDLAALWDETYGDAYRPPPAADQWTLLDVPLDAGPGIARVDGDLILPSGMIITVRVTTSVEPPSGDPAGALPPQAAHHGPVTTFRYGSHDAPTRLEVPLSAAAAPLPADAMRIGPGSHHGQLLLESSRPNPTDVFSFVVSDDDTLGLSGNALFDLRDPKGRPAGVDRSEVAIPQPAPGTWFLRVKQPASPTGEYAFQLNVAPPPVPIEHDDAGSGRDATAGSPVTIGHGTHAGTLGGTDGEDSFHLPAGREQPYDVALTHGPEARYALYLDGEQVASPASRISYEAETHRVEVRRVGGEGPYELRVALGPLMDRSIIPPPQPLPVQVPSEKFASPDGLFITTADDRLIELVGDDATTLNASWTAHFLSSDAAGRIYGYADHLPVLSRMADPLAPQVDIVRGGGGSRVGADGALYGAVFDDKRAYYARILAEGFVPIGNTTQFPGQIFHPIPAPDGSHLLFAWDRLIRLSPDGASSSLVYDGLVNIRGIDVAADGTVFLTAWNETLMSIGPDGSATVLSVASQAGPPTVGHDRVFLTYRDAGGTLRLGAVPVAGVRPFLGPATFEPPARPDLVVVGVREETVSSLLVDDVAEERKLIVTVRNAGAGHAAGLAGVGVSGSSSGAMGCDPCGAWSRTVRFDLAPGEETAIAFDWDTTRSVGRYRLEASVATPPGSDFNFIIEDQPYSSMAYETYVHADMGRP